MHQYLLTICPVFLWIFAAFQLFMLLRFFKEYGKTKKMLFLLSGLVACGLFYDSLILALGTVLPEGGFLKAISQIRYISHGALIPLLLPICAYALDMKKTGKTIVWAITGVLIAVGIGSGIATVTVPESVGTVRYAMDSAATPGWASTISTTVLAFGMVIPLIIAGIIVWKKQKTPALFLSGFLMFLFSGLGAVDMEMMFFISMFGEALMVLFFMIYAKKGKKE